MVLKNLHFHMINKKLGKKEKSNKKFKFGKRQLGKDISDTKNGFRMRGKMSQKFYMLS